MARTVTLTQLRDNSLLAADLPGHGAGYFCSTAELDFLINQYTTEVYDLLVAAYGPTYYGSVRSFNTVAGTSTYNLDSAAPNDNFYKLLGIDILVNGDTLTARPFEWSDRNKYKSTLSNWDTSTPVNYRLYGGTIIFIPTPAGVYPVNMWFIPRCPTLSAVGDTFDGVNGWERLIIVSVAIALKQKAEEDVSILMAEKALLITRLQSMSANRDVGAPRRIGATRARRYL